MSRVASRSSADMPWPCDVTKWLGLRACDVTMPTHQCRSHCGIDASVLSSLKGPGTQIIGF